ncbi:MAG: hypothetical protein PHD11_09005 [Bacteroidales bacterium]|nr:hypothetical protein [Bacteroidales bacterium]MDD4670972.1 hypothetical protein [Bacteroidales bacterium]
MADFIYDYNHADLALTKFNNLYRKQVLLHKGLTVYHNDNIISESNDTSQIIVIGFASVINRNINEYLKELLSNFTPDIIPQIKKELIGQYTTIIKIGDKAYIFSDFLQIRSIFYSFHDHLISTSFETLYNILGNNAAFVDKYKYHEFFTLKKCCYPGWMGNVTIDSRILRLREYEYLTVDLTTGNISVSDITIKIDNTKIFDVNKLELLTLETLRNTTCYPEYKDKTIQTTLTGGFDSRLITSIVHEYYPMATLRIATFKGVSSWDYYIARKLSKIIGSSIKDYETDTSMEDLFFDLTDGLAPKENSIITNLLLNANDCELGFGGTFGTELYSTLPFNTIDEVITSFSAKAKANIDEEIYVEQFIEAVKSEFDNISTHFILKEHNERDIIRLFLIINTSSFASQILSAYDIFGKQCEPIATFPAIEEGLKIPYEYQGSSTTFGRFYMIPKMIIKRINMDVGKVMAVHFCPMLPLSYRTAHRYITGKIRCKIYYAIKRIKQRKAAPVTDDWDKGFLKKYHV